MVELSATCPRGGRACNGYIEPTGGDTIAAGEPMARRVFSDVHNMVVQEPVDTRIKTGMYLVRRFTCVCVVLFVLFFWSVLFSILLMCIPYVLFV